LKNGARRDVALFDLFDRLRTSSRLGTLRGHMMFPNDAMIMLPGRWCRGGGSQARCFGADGAAIDCPVFLCSGGDAVKICL